MRLLSTILLCLAFATNVVANEPVIHLDFEGKPTDARADIKVSGKIQWGAPGPRPAEFPTFADANQAIYLDGKSYLTIKDSGVESRFDFHNGDAITIEAWVRLEQAREATARYIVGKGRTNSAGFARDNQNWALRVSTEKGVAKLSFLFASKGPGNHWHRWTSTNGFSLKDEWHHVAITYRFGEPTTIRGWIDGEATEGVWDLGGATRKPPVVDNDAVWVGSSLGGNATSCWKGWLDDIRVHRQLIDDTFASRRFRRVGGPRVLKPEPPRMPELGEIPAGRALITFSENMPSNARWPNGGETWPDESMRFLGSGFLLPRVPLRYDDWGIRTGWRGGLLVRIAGDVQLDPGKYRLIVRARSLSRLWIDGKLVASTPAITKAPPNGEEPITPVAKRSADQRPLGYHQQEIQAEFLAPEKGIRSHRVVFETVTGGKDRRVEIGETLVAIQHADSAEPRILTPIGAAQIGLHDHEVAAELTQLELRLAELDVKNRRAAAQSQDAFWAKRHRVAAQWATENPAPSVPQTRSPQSHPIDAFLQRKLELAEQRRLAGASADAEQFHNQVLPILRKACFRCHDQKVKGGLVVSSRDGLLHGGDSQSPAVEPGKPEESELLLRIKSDEDGYRMPPIGGRLTSDQVATLTRWIEQGAKWPAPPVSAAELRSAPRLEDARLLRRIYLDVVGVPPTDAELREFLADRGEDRIERRINHLLTDKRFADNWMGEWLDMLAENPTLLNKSQGSTGPFRFFLHDSLRDDKSLDRLVTELILMRGGAEEGGSAGFALAAENDAPFAGKAHIIASAFQGVEMQCARCHDAPFHDVTQENLFSLAAMLQRKPASVPGTSRVPIEFFENSQGSAMIAVTLKPGQPVKPAWPFESIAGLRDGKSIDALLQAPGDSRERLAALITAPGNQRFAKVMVNRIWKRLLGAGIVEPVHDWEGRSPSHPDLLAWLAHELVANRYDAKHVFRLIMTSDAYQRQALGDNATASAERRYFNAPDARRMTAEQVVDSLYHVTQNRMAIGELTFVHDGKRPLSNRQTLGRPSRAWMLASLNNERDRPSLSLPKAQAVTDVLEAFGWTGSRQKPIGNRETEANPLQPGAIANGALTNTLTRASRHSALANLAVSATSPEALVERLFRQILSRNPTAQERAIFAKELAIGFANRLVPKQEQVAPSPPEELPLVTWFNHLRPEANTIQQELEQRVRRGPPADPRLRPEWREVYEDVVWSLLNHREFVWIP